MDIMEESSTSAPAVDGNARQPSNHTTSSFSADANVFGGQPGFSTEPNVHATELDSSRSPTAYPTRDHLAELQRYGVSNEVSSQQSIQGTLWPSTSFASSHSGYSLSGHPCLDGRGGDCIAPAQLKTPWTPRTTIAAEGASAQSTGLQPRRLTESTTYDVDGSATASADGSGTYDGNAPSSDTATPGEDKHQLRRLVDTIDATLKHTRQNSPNDTDELVSLSHRLVVALDQLMEVEDDVRCTLLYHHILIQSLGYIRDSAEADAEVQRECAGFEGKANERLGKLAGSFEYTEIIAVFMAMEASNIAVPIIDRGKEIFGSDRSKLGSIQACVYDILHHINDCIINGVDAETFKQGHLRYRHALGVAIKDRTGKTPNLGDGLSEFITLIIVMNFATPECESYACPSGDEFSKMDLGNSCVSAWHKSFPTLIEKDTGILTSSHRGTDGAVKDIGFIDRLCFISESNKSKNGEVQDMSEVLKEGCIDKTDLHLVFACNLLAKVLYLNLKGKHPSILATGAPVRDNLFEQTEAMLSPRAEFGGCVPHSEMWMRKGSMLYFYGPDELQEFSKTLNLVYSVSSVTASINSRAAEKWTLFDEMSPEEYVAFKTLVDEAMRANREKGGEESARLLLLAKEMEEKGWNDEAISAVMKDEFARFLLKDQYSGAGGRDLLIENMKGRLGAGEESARLLLLAKAMEEKDWGDEDLSAEMKEEFARFLRKEKYSGAGGRDLLIKNMKSRRRAWADRKLLVPLRHAFWETARKNKIAAVVSEEVRDLLPPEHRAEFNRLSREQYDNNDGLLLQKLEDLHAGWDAALDTAIERYREVRIPIWKSNWSAMFDKLVEYKKKHGHCNVPIAYPQLGQWVQTQRNEYKRYQKGLGSSMKESNVEVLGDRKAWLNEIGFVWNTRTEKSAATANEASDVASGETAEQQQQRKEALERRKREARERLKAQKEAIAQREAATRERRKARKEASKRAKANPETEKEAWPPLSAGAPRQLDHAGNPPHPALLQQMALLQSAGAALPGMLPGMAPSMAGAAGMAGGGGSDLLTALLLQQQQQMLQQQLQMLQQQQQQVHRAAKRTKKNDREST